MIKAKLKIDSMALATKIEKRISDMIDNDEELAHLADSEKVALANINFTVIESVLNEVSELDLVAQ